jgi:SAM-dependent methyltransferase
MTQAYGAAFARVYNQRWTGFAQNAAPLLLQFYQSSPLGQAKQPILDLCCGTGQLARHFLEAGFHVIGLDLSTSMLELARKNNLPFLVSGQVRFIHADAANFSLDEPVGLVVSTFDALNHLPDLNALTGCFKCVVASLVDNGIFIFDLNTLQGLKDRWVGMMLEETPDFFLLNRGLWIDEFQRAYTRIVGFQRQENGLFERFEETAYNTAFDLQAVRQALLDGGFRRAYFARLSELSVPIENPDGENRIFFVACK